MKWIENLTRKLVYAGISEDRDMDASLRLQMANLSALFGIGSDILFNIMYFYFDIVGASELPFINAFLGILMGLTIYLNFKGMYKLGRYLLLFSLPALLIMNTVMFYGNLLGLHYFFLLFSLLPFLTLAYKDRFKILLYFLLNLVFFFYIVFFHSPPKLMLDNPLFGSELQDYFQFVSTTVACSIMGIFLLFFLRTTNRNQAELRKVNADKDRIFSILAHDLKGPIGSMGTYLGILLESKSKYSESELTRGLVELQKNTNQCYVVLENLLEWVKQGSNGFQFHPESLSLLKMIERTLELFKIQSNEKKIVWNIDVSSLHILYVDDRMLSTVLRNLFSNAIKFSNPNGDILIRSKDLGERIELTCTDQGIGISQAKLFDILSGNEIKSEFGTSGERGTGIGLQVCLELLKVQNSTLSIESDVGHGTKITLNLPKSI